MDEAKRYADFIFRKTKVIVAITCS
jgi:hypothetical protein